MSLLSKVLKKDKVSVKKRDRKLLEGINKIYDTLDVDEDGLKVLSVALKEEVQDTVSKISKEDKAKFVMEVEKVLEGKLEYAYALAKRAVYLQESKVLYDVQILGGINLNDGNIAEMKTGEGKTLTSVLPIYLNALTGLGVHVITTNSYLSERDALELQPILKLLGITVGINRENDDESIKREAYSKDVTYSIHSEIAFDYLRDNMKVLKSEKVNPRGLNVAIIDEADSILIDEARTPLIISGRDDAELDMYKQMNSIIKNQVIAKKGYEFDFKKQVVTLTPEGDDIIEKALGIDNLYELGNSRILNIAHQVLKAHFITKKGVDYLVKGGKIHLLDVNTGRVMKGKQYSDGLHQSIEAKEGLEISPESRENAKITYQNFFRLYSKLCGMTGTAKTEEEEFLEVYNMKVIQIPTHLPIQREDLDDVLYVTKEEKLDEIVRLTKELNKKGIPVLIGTKDVEYSEVVSRRLTTEGVVHNVLNAKNHELEAEIISNSGKKGMVTVATNMAGRGTDIKLGEGVEELGGLVVIGTDKHESRRIDNQLRGRSGRQGERGSSIYILSLEDDLIRRFVPDSMFERMKKYNYEEGMPLKANFISKAVESAQKRLEGNNFDSRKEVLKYDNVLDTHRRVVYGLRDDLVEDIIDIRDIIVSLIEDVLYYDSELLNYTIDESIFKSEMGRDSELETLVKTGDSLKVADYIIEKLKGVYGDKRMEDAFRYKYIFNLDKLWVEHLENMSDMLLGIHLKGYAQEDPLRWYQKQAMILFNDLMTTVCKETIKEMLLVKDGEVEKY